MKFEFLFEDGSLFSVPTAWREVYELYYGTADPVELEARLRFVVGKYVAHGAIPSKFGVRPYGKLGGEDVFVR